MLTPARITDPATALTYIEGGRGRFTLVSRRTGRRFTFRTARPKDAEDKERSPLFVRLLTGPDNDNDYQYIGFVRSREYIHGGRKSRAGPDAPSVRAFAWALGNLVLGRIPDEMEFWHEGQCCRCARALTVPASIERGMGPRCAGAI